jgi:hypothetical protein
MRRQIIELVAAVVAAAAAVWCWFGAQTIVTVAPILPGEPQTTYSPPLLVLMLLLATLAGVLAVVGITGLITGGRVGSAAAALATGPTSASGPS